MVTLARCDSSCGCDWFPVDEPDDQSLTAAEREKLQQYHTKKKAKTGAMGDDLTEEDQRDIEGLRADDKARDPALLQFQLRVARAPDQVSCSTRPWATVCLFLPCCVDSGLLSRYTVSLLSSFGLLG